MIHRRTLDWNLLAGGILTAGMGLYHFWLPAQFGWGKELAHDPMLRWALLSINTFFSYLLLGGGVVSIAIGAQARSSEPAARWVLMVMTGFWILNACYQVLLPMPLPPRLAILHTVLLLFAVATALFFALALWSARRQRPAGEVAGRDHHAG
jgi:hypothetical protein